MNYALGKQSSSGNKVPGLKLTSIVKVTKRNIKPSLHQFKSTKVNQSNRSKCNYNHAQTHHHSLSFSFRNSPMLSHTNSKSCVSNTTLLIKPFTDLKALTSELISLRANIRTIKLAHIKYIDKSHSLYIKEKINNSNNNSQSKLKSSLAYYNHPNSSFSQSKNHLITDPSARETTIKECNLSFSIADNYSLTNSLSLRKFISTHRNICDIRHKLNFKYEILNRNEDNLLNNIQYYTNRLLNLKHLYALLSEETRSTVNEYIKHLQNEVSNNFDILNVLKYDKERASNEIYYIINSISKLKVVYEYEVKCRNLMIQVKHLLTTLPSFLSLRSAMKKFDLVELLEKGFCLKWSKSKKFTKRKTFRKSTSYRLNLTIRKQSSKELPPTRSKAIVDMTKIRKANDEIDIDIDNDVNYNDSNSNKHVSSHIELSKPMRSSLRFSTDKYLMYLNPKEPPLIFETIDEFIDVLEGLESNNLIREKKYLSVENDILLLRKELSALTHYEAKEELDLLSLQKYESKLIELKEQYKDSNERINYLKEKAFEKTHINIKSSNLNQMIKDQSELIVKPSLSYNYLRQNRNIQINMEIFNRLKGKATKEYRLVYLYTLEIIKYLLDHNPQSINICKEPESKQNYFRLIINEGNINNISDNDLRHYIIELLIYIERALNYLFIQYKKEKSYYSDKVNMIFGQLNYKKKRVKVDNLRFIHQKQRTEMINSINKKKNKIYVLPIKKVFKPYHIRSKIKTDEEIGNNYHNTLSISDLFISSSDENSI